MAKLGLPVVYRAHDLHSNVVVGREPVRDEHGKQTRDGDGKAVFKDIIHASIHHPTMRDFAAVVTQVLEGNRCNLTIFPPNREPKPVDDVAYGIEGHTWHHIDEHDDMRDPALPAIAGDQGEHTGA